MAHPKRARQRSGADGQLRKDLRGSPQELLPSIQQLLDAQSEQIWNKFQMEIRGLESRITTEIKQFEANIAEVITSVDYNANDIEHLKNDTIPNMKKQVEEDRMQLKEEIDRLSTYISRENLVFLGIPEKEPENGAENVSKVLEEFYTSHLKLDFGLIEGIQYQRVHRIAAAVRPRPIKARFVHYADRELVLKNAKNLKGTKMYISQDLPIRTRQQRRQQMEALREARKAGKLAYFSKTEPWKLYVDRVVLPIEKQAGFIDQCRRTGQDKRSNSPLHPVPGATSTKELSRGATNVRSDGKAKADEGMEVHVEGAQGGKPV